MRKRCVRPPETGTSSIYQLNRMYVFVVAGLGLAGRVGGGLSDLE